jgi:hypothetical protein
VPAEFEDAPRYASHLGAGSLRFDRQNRKRRLALPRNAFSASLRCLYILIGVAEHGYIVKTAYGKRMKVTELLAGALLIGYAGEPSRERPDLTTNPVPSRVEPLPQSIPGALPSPFAQGSSESVYGEPPQPIPRALPLPLAQGSNESVQPPATRMPDPLVEKSMETWSNVANRVGERFVNDLGMGLRQTARVAVAAGAVIPLRSGIDSTPRNAAFGGFVGVATGSTMALAYGNPVAPSSTSAGAVAASVAAGVTLFAQAGREQKRKNLQKEVDRKFSNPQSEEALGTFLGEHPNVQTAELLLHDEGTKVLILFPPHETCYECGLRKIPEEASRLTAAGSVARRVGNASRPFDLKVTNFCEQFVGLGEGGQFIFRYQLNAARPRTTGRTR